MYRLLALHAHPDDESSKGAATVAKYVDEGVRAVLVTATGGEAGDILNPAMDRPDVLENLAAIRFEELQKAAAVIGYSDVIMLGYRDSGMPDSEHNMRPDAFTNAADAEVLEKLVTIVRRERPHVVLGYDSHERYPHPDHLAIHRHGLELFAAAADPAVFPDAGPPWSIAKLYAPMFSVRRLMSLHEAMERLGEESPFAEWIEKVDPAADVGKRVTSIDVGATLQRGREALRAHRTQVDPDGFWFRIPEQLVRDTYPYEDFELLASRVPVEPGETSAEVLDKYMAYMYPALLSRACHPVMFGSAANTAMDLMNAPGMQRCRRWRCRCSPSRWRRSSRCCSACRRRGPSPRRTACCRRRPHRRAAAACWSGRSTARCAGC